MESHTDFIENLKSFCFEINELFKANTLKTTKEVEMEKIHKQVWQIIQMTKTSEVICPEGNFLQFSYKYSAAQFNKNHQQHYFAYLQDLEHFFPSVNISLYFKKFIQEQTITNYVVETITEESKFLLLETVLDMMSFFQ